MEEEFLEECINESSNIYQKIVDAKLIDKQEYNILMMHKKQNTATEFDKIKLLKRYYCDILGKTDIEYDEIKFWYYKTYLLKNYKNLLNLDNFHKTKEINNKIAFEKLELVNDIINKLGFDNINDNTKYINSESLINNFKIITETNKLFINNKASFLFFKVKPLKFTNETTTKQILGYLNSILDNFSIKLDNKRIRINSQREYVYFIKILNEVDVIVNRTCNNDEENTEEITL